MRIKCRSVPVWPTDSLYTVPTQPQSIAETEPTQVALQIESEWLKEWGGPLVVDEDWDLLLGQLHFEDIQGFCFNQGAWPGIAQLDGPGVEIVVLVGGPCLELEHHAGASFL